MRVVFILLAAMIGFAGANERLSFDNYGFSIEQLPAPKEINGSHYAAIFFIPDTDLTFAPNVNVQVQKFSGTMKEFEAISDEQFKSGIVGDVKIFQKKFTDKVGILEYEAEMSGMKLHLYQKAIMKGGFVYLATATALPSQWGRVGAALKKNVDSVELLK